MNYLEEDDLGYGVAAEPETVMQINRELELARRIVEETGANLFLTGKAGTGKTTFLRRLREFSHKRMVVLAPTGVAAINAGGMTMHSFFQLPFSPFIPGRGFLGEEKRFYRMSKDKRRLIASLDLIVIDEISMVRPDTLDGIDRLLRRMRGIDRPFGGIQLLLIGDLRQLAPVVRPDEWEMLRDFYSSPYFFESHSLREAGFMTIELKTIYRQQDPEFISLLNSIRDGNADREVLNRLNLMCRPAEQEEDDLTIRLTTHNRIADDTNARHLAMLTGDATVFEANIKGKFPESSYPADKFLTLKVGARVMFIKNDSGNERKYYNGLIGTVTGISENTVYVLPDDDDSDAIEVGYAEWENTSFRVDDDTKEITQQIDGVFAQIPLRLAWAITIHKSQGLTFDRAVIDAEQSFAPGQLYVALSRCRSLEGMRLETRLSPHAVIIDNDVNSFIDNSRKSAPDETRLNQLRDEYFRSLLAELFDFNALGIKLRDFARVVTEYVAPIYPRLFDSYRAATREFSERIENVGNKFISLYASGRIDADAASTNSAFLGKISNGCLYFLEQLAPICKVLNETPMELDNSAYQQRLLTAADLLWFEMNLKKTILKGLTQEDFSPTVYMKYKAHAVLEDMDASSTSAKSPKKRVPRNKKDSESPEVRKPKEKKEKKPKGYSQRVTLQMFRDGKSIEEISAARDLAPGTIAGHLGEMVRLGEIKLEEVLPQDMMAIIENAVSQLRNEGKEGSYGILRERLSDSLPSYYISLYTHSQN